MSGNVVGTAYVELKLDDKTFLIDIEKFQNTAVNAATTMEKSFSSSAVKMGAVMGVAMAGVNMAIQTVVGALRSIPQKIQEWTLLAARVETLGVVMYQVGKNAGYSKQELDSFREGVKAMGITTSEASQTIVKMTQQNIDLKQATDLARVAQDAAVIGQTNSSDALGRMIHAISTRNTLILRNIGLTIDQDAAQKKYAESIGKTTEQLTVAEKQQALVNAVLEKGKDIAGTYEASMQTAGKQLGSMARLVEELGLEVGNIFLPVFTDIMKDVVDGFKTMRKYIKTLDENGTILKIQQVLATIYEVLKSDIMMVMKDLFSAWEDIYETADGGALQAFKEIYNAIVSILAAVGPIYKFLNEWLNPMNLFAGILSRVVKLLHAVATWNVEGMKQGLADLSQLFVDKAKRMVDTAANLGKNIQGNLQKIDDRNKRVEEKNKALAEADALKKKGHQDGKGPGRTITEEDKTAKKGKDLSGKIDAWERKLRDLEYQLLSLNMTEFEKKVLDLDKKHIDLIEEANRAEKEGIKVDRERIAVWYEGMKAHLQEQEAKKQTFDLTRRQLELEKNLLSVVSRTKDLELSIAEAKGANVELQRIEQRYADQLKMMSLERNLLQAELLKATKDEIAEIEHKLSLNQQNIDALSGQLALEKELLAIKQEQRKDELKASMAMNLVGKKGGRGIEADVALGYMTKVEETMRDRKIADAMGDPEVYDLAWKTFYENMTQYTIEAYQKGTSAVQGMEAAILQMQENQLTAGQVAFNVMMDTQSALSSTMSTFLTDLRNGEMKSFEEYFLNFTNKLLDSWTNMLTDMVSQWIMQSLFMKANPLGGGGGGGGLFGGGGGGGGIMGFLSGLFGGGMADGGHAKKGVLYEVGERQPEIFSSGGKNYLLPGQDGQVNPSAEGSDNIKNEENEMSVKIINVLDPSIVDKWATSSEGEKVLVNIIRRNQ